GSGAGAAAGGAAAGDPPAAAAAATGADRMFGGFRAGRVRSPPSPNTTLKKPSVASVAPPPPYSSLSRLRDIPLVTLGDETVPPRSSGPGRPGRRPDAMSGADGISGRSGQLLGHAANARGRPARPRSDPTVGRSMDMADRRYQHQQQQLQQHQHQQQLQQQQQQPTPAENRGQPRLGVPFSKLRRKDTRRKEALHG
ncbi:unnamed protein product, partial [Laminaria digitata]